MLKVILLTIIIVAVSSTAIGRNAAGSLPDLSQFKWENRLLLLFAPHRDHPFFDSLRQGMMNRERDVADRDLIVVEILEEGPSTVNGADIDRQTVLSLRKQFDAPIGGFTLVLIGKDGEVKLNRREKTEIEDIFNLIDSMPMRQEEMRKK